MTVVLCVLGALIESGSTSHPGSSASLLSRRTSPSTDILRIEVTDARGDDLPCHQRPGLDAESGRGLLLVETFADRWGIELGPVPRKTVWAELDLSPELANLNSGAPGDLHQETRWGKEPNQAPPLPPTASTHSRE